MARVSGRVRARVTARPPAQQPKVPSHNDHASVVLLRARSCTCRPRVVGLVRAMLAGHRYGIVTTQNALAAPLPSAASGNVRLVPGGPQAGGRSVEVRGV